MFLSAGPLIVIFWQAILYECINYSNIHKFHSLGVLLPDSSYCDVMKNGRKKNRIHCVNLFEENAFMLLPGQCTFGIIHRLLLCERICAMFAIVTSCSLSLFASKFALVHIVECILVYQTATSALLSRLHINAMQIEFFEINSLHTHYSQFQFIIQHILY